VNPPTEQVEFIINLVLSEEYHVAEGDIDKVIECPSSSILDGQL
jgi:hypothetical protein